jgi:hypothetical protein
MPIETSYREIRHRELNCYLSERRQESDWGTAASHFVPEPFGVACVGRS